MVWSNGGNRETGSTPYIYTQRHPLQLYITQGFLGFHILYTAAVGRNLTVVTSNSCNWALVVRLAWSQSDAWHETEDRV